MKIRRKYTEKYAKLGLQKIRELFFYIFSRPTWGIVSDRIKVLVVRVSARRISSVIQLYSRDSSKVCDTVVCFKCLRGLSFYISLNTIVCLLCYFLFDVFEYILQLHVSVSRYPQGFNRPTRSPPLTIPVRLVEVSIRPRNEKDAPR